MFGLGYGEFLTGLLLVKAGVTFLWQEYQKGQQAFLKILGRSQTQAAKNLSDALGKLVARGKNKGIDSYELYRNLEKLLPLLCLDASHQYVSDRLRNLSSNIRSQWVEKVLEEQDSIFAVMMFTKHLFGGDMMPFGIGRSLNGAMNRLFRWDPEYAEVFESTKVDFKGPKADMDMEAVEEMKHPMFPYQLAAKKDRARVEPAFRKLVEGNIGLAKAIHDTQREFAAALRESDALHSSYNPTHHAKANRKAREAEGLREKLVKLSDGFTFKGLSLMRDSIGAYCLALLVCRFKTDRALGRKTEIAALFDAVGATGAEREEIESHIGSLYGAVRRCWLKDDWIETTRLNYSPFSGFHGWRKAASKCQVRFLEHYDLFQLKSPRQLTEESVLGIVQTMEGHEDKVFVRESRLNSELQQIYNRAVNNERHGKFDAAIADLKSLLHRVSEASVPNAVDYPDETLSAIHCYLACIYANRGEHLEEAVKLAKHALEIQDSLLARLALGWSYHRQGEVAAIEELEVAKSAATRAGSGLLPLVHLVLGDAYRDAERHQDAEEAWREGWELADDPAWKDQAELTPFEVKERANLQKELGERLG